MTLLYDYNISVIIGNYLLRALANDEDLNLNIFKLEKINRQYKSNKSRAIFMVNCEYSFILIIIYNLRVNLKKVESNIENKIIFKQE